MGPTVYLSRLLVMTFEVPSCRPGTQQGKASFCHLYSTNRCSDRAPSVSDRCIVNVDLLMSFPLMVSPFA